MQEKLLVTLPLQTVLFLTLRLTVGHTDPLPSPVPPCGLRPWSLPSQLLLPTRKPPLPPSFSSFRPDPECSACCSAVQSPESSPSSWRAICSICLCPAHLASCPGPVVGSPRGCQAAGGPLHRLKGASFSSLHQKTSLHLLWSPGSSITTCPSPPRT